MHGGRYCLLFFALSLAVGLYFLIRSRKDGYWSKDGENVKYRVFEDEPVPSLVNTPARGEPVGRTPWSAADPPVGLSSPPDRQPAESTKE